MAPDEQTYTVKEMIGDLRIDLRQDISEVAHKVADVDRKLDVRLADHAGEHATHDKVHLEHAVEAATDRVAAQSLDRAVAGLQEVVSVHEKRWQRIIGVLLVLTFLGVGTLGAILLLLWSVLGRLTA